MNHVVAFGPTESHPESHPGDDTLLTVEHLCKVYGGDESHAAQLARAGHSREEIVTQCGSFVAVSDASLEVRRGEIFVIMGLSGSGKSTLLRCVNRLIEPTAGCVRFNGEDLVAASEARLRELRLSKISMVFQHFALFPHKTVIDNVSFGLKLGGLNKVRRHQIALNLLRQVGLVGWETHFPSDLSGGMKQRVGLARSLAVNPDLLLMDEAFSALDPVIRREMQIELLRLQKQLNKAILFITHDIQEALLLGDRIAMMKDGRIVQCGTPCELILKPADEFVADFTRDADRARILKVRDIMVSLSEFNQTAGDGSGYFVETNSAGGFSRLQTCVPAGSGPGHTDSNLPMVQEDDRLGAVLPLAKSPLLIVVAGADGRVVGALTRERLLGVLSE
jgi:glycine betaine/proline transport system ATP-binding protein